MICYHEDLQLLALETAHTAYWISLAGDMPLNVYWGPTIDVRDAGLLAETDSVDAFDAEQWRERAEYPACDGRTFGATAVQADCPLFFKTDAYHIQGDELTIELRDEATGHRVSLEYTVNKKNDVIRRRAVLRAGAQPLVLRKAASGVCSLPAVGDGWTAHYTAGSWAGEFRRRAVPLEEGALRLGSNRGMSGPHFNPAVLIGEKGAPDDRGQAYAILLGWSGNWQITAAQTVYRHTVITAAQGGEDYKRVLAPEETLETPFMYLACGMEGLNGLSRSLHAYDRDCLRPGSRPRRVLYNSWEPTQFHVNESNQRLLAQRAAAMGVELFVVDDGWFGRRDSDSAGLGDWYVNREKFPDGLESFIAYVKSLGMDFGLWVEPEAVNPDSDLYRAHPDWIHRLPNHEPVKMRRQYQLDWSRAEVESYLLDTLRGLLRRYDISYLKWDMNRPFADINEQETPGRRERHVEALYRVLDTLEAEFPQVDIEGCSGGGARVDWGMLPRSHQFWPSDNTDPYERLLIQEGYSLCHAPERMSCWVTDTEPEKHCSGRNSLRYKFHAAMCGSLGVGADISRFSHEELKLCTEEIAYYKTIRHLISGGMLYRLLSPSQHELSAVEYCLEDGTEFVLFTFLRHQVYRSKPARVRLQHLLEGGRYRCLETQERASGSTLMRIGIQPTLHGDFDSAVSHWVLD